VAPKKVFSPVFGVGRAPKKVFKKGDPKIKWKQICKKEPLQILPPQKG